MKLRNRWRSVSREVLDGMQTTLIVFLVVALYCILMMLAVPPNSTVIEAVGDHPGVRLSVEYVAKSGWVRGKLRLESHALQGTQAYRLSADSVPAPVWKGSGLGTATGPARELVHEFWFAMPERPNRDTVIAYLRSATVELIDAEGRSSVARFPAREQSDFGETVTTSLMDPGAFGRALWHYWVAPLTDTSPRRIYGQRQGFASEGARMRVPAPQKGAVSDRPTDSPQHTTGTERMMSSTQEPPVHACGTASHGAWGVRELGANRRV